jgi:hypothetical protein
MRAQVAVTEKCIATFAEQARTGQTFAERDEGRIGQSQAEERLINERALLNAVDRLIKLASGRRLPGRKIPDFEGFSRCFSGGESGSQTHDFSFIPLEQLRLLVSTSRSPGAFREIVGWPSVGRHIAKPWYSELIALSFARECHAYRIQLRSFRPRTGRVAPPLALRPFRVGGPIREVRARRKNWTPRVAHRKGGPSVPVSRQYRGCAVQRAGLPNCRASRRTRRRGCSQTGPSCPCCPDRWLSQWATSGTQT